MAEGVKGTEAKFVELGKELASPPSSAEELYSLLDKIDGQLSTVEQSPSPSMLEALQPLMKALTMNDVLGHSDMDVKVAVASCISEITRITAPEAPYDDDIMKEIFQMIVAAFEGLDDITSRAFQKRISILETVAKVRSCVVMLDLECDALIHQMFNYFRKTIRENHSENVFSSMETIMSLVIEESEDISTDLLSPLLEVLKNDNKDALPIAQKLAKKVISNCAPKIRPYLMELIQSKGAPLSEYNEVVASICQEDHKETHASAEILADDSKISERTISDELPQVSAKMEQEVGCPEKVVSAADVSTVEATSNGTVQLENNDTMEEPSSPKQMSEQSRRNGQLQNAPSSQAIDDNSEAVSVKSDGITDVKKARGRKANTSVQSTDTTGDSRTDSDKDASIMTNRRKGRAKEANSSKVDKASGMEVEPAGFVEPEKKNEENISVAPPASVENPTNSARNKGRRPPGSKASAKSTDVDAVAQPPATASAQKDHSGSGETHDEAIKENNTEKQREDADDGEEPANVTSDTEVKPRSRGKKGRPKKEAAERETSGRKRKSHMKQQKEQDAAGKDIDGEQTLKDMDSSLRSTSKAPSVDQTDLDDSVKPMSRRKHPLKTENISHTPDNKKKLDASLVGSKIKVWWPDDKEFYGGVVDSYDPDTKKHTVAYEDGDIEVLLLMDERWEYMESDSRKDGKRKAEGNAEISQSKKVKGSLSTTSKQSKSQAQSKSGKDSGSKDVSRPRGRPRNGASNPGKLSLDDTPGTSKKSRGKPASDDKTRTPRSSGKLKDVSDHEAGIETPKASSKREDHGNKSKEMTSKGQGKGKDELPKSARRSKNKTLKANSKGSSKSGDDSTPKTATRSEVNEVSKNQSSRTRTPKTSDSKVNGSISNKGKAKVGESGSTPLVSDGEASKGAKKRKRKGRK
ncbi:uncharacterized protein A4U43_C08F18550 [Asparagus officinalis]|uniref:claspin n=1 Tax=Asparagus officinalis TaxID=4686 RepID=UPI00098E39BB|nr:claspin [Asparagus officinalis]XP_020241436.1 claspin [Asparagus officinalis]ONK60445.1 uncharacterized protein A4U43_C08F18550 [Asparagus officinalis]